MLLFSSTTWFEEYISKGDHCISIMEAESFGDLGVSGRMGDSSEESDDLDECDSYGYEAIDRSCKIVYADQPNPLQYTPRVQIW